MNDHLDELRLLDALHGGPDADARAHLAGCAACARALADEAALDQRLWQARAGLEACAGCGALEPADAARCATCGAARRVGGYRVTGVRSRGERGRVYVAEDASGRRVALKEVELPHGDVARKDALEREARLLGDLRHPRVPRLIEHFVAGDGAAQRFYLAQELVAGETLLERLAHHRFDEAEAIAIARQVLEVLVHLQGLAPPVFHRDLKPANLIRRPSGALAVVDFGAARDLGATQGGSLVGTYGYAPTEQLVGIVDATTDLHALGATLLHLLSARAPWEWDAPPSEVALQVSAGLRGFVARLTASDPAARFASAADALEALDELASGRAATPRRTGRRRLAWAGSAMAAATAIGYGGFRAAADAGAAADRWLPGASHDASSPLARTFILFAIAGAVVLAVRLTLQALGAHGHGDHGHDHGDHGHDVGAEVLTLQGAASFLLMYGTVGLALLLGSPAGGALALLGGAGAGVGAMLGTAGLFTLAGRLQSSGTLDLRRAVGATGTVYLSIPEGGTGVVQLPVQGRLIELDAATADGRPLATGARVRVIMLRDRKVAIVEPSASQGESE